MSEKPAYRRRKILINPAFQLRFSFYVVCWIGVLSIAYPSAFYETFEWFIRILASTPAAPDFQSLTAVRSQFLTWLVAAHLGFVVIIFFLSLLLSHRIAGPIFKLSKFLNAARNGDRTHVTFRKSDHFHFLVDDFNHLMDALDEKTAAHIGQIAEIRKKTQDPKVLESLDRLEKSIKGRTIE